jgi:hypothetical protein
MNRNFILKALADSCIAFTPESFIPFLMSDDVIVSMPTKVVFYSFFKRMVICTKNNSVGKLYLKIEKVPFEENQFYYNFYDDVHKFARLTIVVTYLNEKIELDVLPF